MLGTLRYYRDYLIAAGAYLYSRTTHKEMASLEHLESIQQLSPRVIRVLGQNPGPFTLQGTNTYIVGTGKSRFLVDAGEPGIHKYLDELKEALKRFGVETIEAIIVTHWHHDHVGGIPGVFENVIGKSVPVYKIARADAEEDATSYTYLSDGQTLQTEGATLRVIATPGHTSDHLCLYLEEDDVLFSADCILGHGSSVFDDLYEYMRSLNKLKGLNSKQIFPGHGPVVSDPQAKIAEYIHHREVREKQIVDYLKEAKEVTSMDIVNAIYVDIPLSVKLGALNSVKQVLNKLLKEGVIEKSGFENYKYLGS